MKKIHITTPIYYVNDKPHIGHAYTNIMADVFSRFMRMCNVETIFTTGTDEHGSKIEKTALAKNIPVQEYVDEISSEFKSLAQKLNISYDNFIRTTDEKHKNSAIALWNVLNDKGYIYLGKYSGWYSTRDESFYNADELIDGKSPTGSPVECLEEPTYFFKLSLFQEKLMQFYEGNPNFIMPHNKRNEVLSFLKSGLKDLSISRITSKWGIKVPNDENHTMYVWLDALTNYITVLDYPNDTFLEEMCANAVHFIGKDILRFHAIFWPAFLMAADLPLPKNLAVHGWWLNEGEKISKSLGNVINPIELINEFGLDQIRYFLMREIAFGNDGNFSRANLIQRINSELSNNIGNLIQRTLSLIIKNCDYKIPAYSDNDEIITYAHDSTKVFEQHMLTSKFNEALEVIITLSSKANEYIDQNKPWALAKTDKTSMENVLYNLAETIRCIALLLQPFIPSSAEKILDILSISPEERQIEHISKLYQIKPGLKIQNPVAIFPRFIN